MPPNMPSVLVRAKRNKHARSSKPKLLPELENMVLGTFQHLHKPEDLPWLWIGGRHVSKRFRYEIERIFRKLILPEMILHCDLGKLLYDNGPLSVQHAGQGRANPDIITGFHYLCWDVFTSDWQGYAGCDTGMASMKGYNSHPTCFTLDSFSNGNTRAIFKCVKSSAPQEIVFRRLHEKKLVGAPVFSIQVREVVNDTGLPGLQIDDEKEEVSFDWRDMLDQLMGEEHVYNTILAQRLGWYLDSGQDTVNLLKTHRKLARRSRLQRECRANFRSNILDHYVHDEEPALESLRKLRLAVSGDDDNNHKNLAVYTKQKTLDDLPDNATIYSGNSDPSPRPGSVPRGMFTDQDYCCPTNQWRGLPPPSTADLFSPRPLPPLSWGRMSMVLPPKPKLEHTPSHGRRAREDHPTTSPAKRRKLGSD